MWIAQVALLSTLLVSVGWALALRREVRRRRTAETKLILAKEQAERLARIKQDFLTVAAHEVCRPPRVLIADSDPVQQIVLSTTLRRIGIDPDIASGADQAVERWREQRHEVVLADCDLRGTNGPALARRLIEEGGSAVRVIGLSADERDLDLCRAFAAGMSALLPKPASEAQLRHAISTAMSGRTARECADATA